MAYYAFLDENNVVTEVIPGRDEWEEVEGITNWEAAYGEIRGQVCKRTSYNNNIRKQFAGIGYTYDADNDVFIAPQPYASWALDDEFNWQAPTLRPKGTSWYWNEVEQVWINAI